MVFVGERKYKYRNMYMSHMIADSLEELHNMGNLLNIDKKHFQNKKHKPHYDICQSKKQKAIKNGVLLINDREIIKILNTIYYKNVNI
jgi:hypothetical protein